MYREFQFGGTSFGSQRLSLSLQNPLPLPHSSTAEFYCVGSRCSSAGAVSVLAAAAADRQGPTRFGDINALRVTRENPNT